MSDVVESWWVVTEHNPWEGETWRHYILDDEGVEEALRHAVETAPDLRGPELKPMSSAAAEALANVDDCSYTWPHWFGILTDREGLEGATEDDLYKAGLRRYCEEFMEMTEVTP